MALQHIRSSTLDKRPQPASLSDGQLAINTNMNAPGVFFKDSNGALVKVGPTFVGTTAPNSTPGSGGATGNTLGEQWLDTSGGTYVLKIWDGTAWRSEAGEFVNVTGDTMTGALVMDNQQQVRFRETTANGTNYIALQAPASVASDKTITLPDVTGTVVTTGDTGSVTSTMILDGTILNADVNASAAIAGTKISPDFGSQNVTTTGTVTGASLNPTSSTVPTNGVYLPAANSVGISTNGTGRLFVNSSGSVGIGTSAPDQRLVAAGGIASTGAGNYGAGNAAGVYLAYESGGDARLIARSVGTASYLSFWTSTTAGSSERVRITDAGNVGIGTTSPSESLQVTGNIRASGGFFTANGSGFGIFGVDGSSPYLGTAGLATPFVFKVGNGASDVERARIDSSGRLLLGTSSARTNYFNAVAPTTFQVEGTNYQNASASLTCNATELYNASVLVLARSGGTTVGSNTLVSNGQYLGAVSFQGNDGAEFVVSAEIRAEVDGTPGANDMPGRLVFSVTRDGSASPTEAARISSSGEFSTFSAGVNTAVFNSSLAAGTSNAVILGRYGASGYNTGTASFQVLTNGNVQNTNNSYGSLSDLKLKENIVDAGSQWDDLKALQVRKYNFKEGQTHTQIGLVAQEVELVSPGLVSESPDRDAEGNDLGTVTKSVNYSVLYMKAVKALQEAMERIETLEAKVAALESA